MMWWEVYIEQTNCSSKET